MDWGVPTNAKAGKPLAKSSILAENGDEIGWNFRLRRDRFTVLRPLRAAAWRAVGGEVADDLTDSGLGNPRTFGVPVFHCHTKATSMGIQLGMTLPILLTSRVRIFVVLDSEASED